jgi:hypothetical protein
MVRWVRLLDFANGPTTMADDREKLAPAALLRRVACAEALTNAGFPISAKTLASMATRGGGPPYRTFGRVVLYRWSEALGWAEGRLTPPRSSTSETPRHVPAADPRVTRWGNPTLPSTNKVADGR